MKNRIRKGLLIFGMAAAVFLGSSTVQAASNDEVSKAFDPACITVDYAGQQMTITETASWSMGHGKTFDMEILFGVSTVKNRKNKQTKETESILTTTSWDVYRFDANAASDRSISIDLSSLNRAKDNYVQIKGNTFNEPVTLKIPAVTKDLKAKYNKLDGIIEITNKKGGEPDLGSSDGFEYRTTYGSWKPFEPEKELSAYQQRGATLYLRAKAPENVNLASGSQVQSVDGILDADGEKIDVLSAGSFPGIELKTSVTKLANAPKVVIDYVKGMITIPKGSLYRIIKTGDETIPEWREDAEDSKITYNVYMDTELQELMEKGGSIEAYKPETEKAPASKIGHIDCSAKEDLILRMNDDETTADLKKTVNGNQVVALEYDEDEKKYFVSDSFIVAELERESSGTKYSLTLTNTSSDAYEVIVQSSDNTPAPTARATKKIAAATANKSARTIKIAKITEGKYVFIRKAGNKSKATWTTNYFPFGKVTLPDEEP